MKVLSPMNRFFALCFLLAASAIHLQAQDVKLEDSTTLAGRIQGPLKKGTVLKTANNHFYEVNEKGTQILSLSQPEVKVIKEGKKYKMLITGLDKPVAVNKLADVIESNIAGDFKGWDGNTVFKLLNRQEWQQDVPTGTIFVNLYNPAVLIYSTPEGYKMKIEGVNEDPIIVKKIR